MSTESWTQVSPDLLDAIRAQYRLDWDGLHGHGHWLRVRENGLRLATTTGADVVVVEYFAALHDACRWTEGRDIEHGPRAAEVVRALDATLLPLDDDRREILAQACRTHTTGTKTDDPTIATCWDADRLDLLRVGIRPDPRYLVTEAAREAEMMAWAMQRSGGRMKRRASGA